MHGVAMGWPLAAAVRYYTVGLNEAPKLFWDRFSIMLEVMR